jgi:hypothetical protein
MAKHELTEKEIDYELAKIKLSSDAATHGKAFPETKKDSVSTRFGWQNKNQDWQIQPDKKLT